ncbi:DNA methyltransferase [Phenylobacterium sp.]|uniref:site-specific DNA-methyltransferase n=1 Tax=Phenylobacterium sp. TaxID=1871053 RepID=UPI001218FF48|nr:DNA methyltransferase [Phenylobacterium sp.]THD64445.1 MAG: DNA methylase N-4 [Phenylobacterium sp.]
MALELIYRRVEELKPHPNNARVHSKKQVAQIVASISEAGFANPILHDENDVIIAGHGRLLAAKQLKIETVPAIQLRGLSEAQKAALRVADNKIAQNSAWDPDLLRLELETIELEGLDLELTGFSTGEIDILRMDDDPDDDQIPEVSEMAISRPGDIWRLNQHRLACGDVRDRELMAKLMAGVTADAAFLDPPYNVKVNGHAGGKGAIKHREFALASGEMSSSEFMAFLKATLGACVAVSRDGAVHFVCMDHPHIEELTQACNSIYGQRLTLCVWVKSNAGMGGLYRSQHELVFVYRVGEAPHRNNVELGKHGRNRTNVWEYASVNAFGARAQDLALHPTVKPVGLVADAIKDVTRPGEVVLDAFLGSGTSLIAAERTRRVFRGVDIDPLYVDLAISRWQDLTGGLALHAETGQSFTQTQLERGRARLAADA